MRTFISENTEENIIGEINITPLTDVFLVLLIIFMVATPFLIQAGVMVKLPASQVAQGQPEGIVITLTKNNRIFVDEDEVELARLQDILRQRIQNDEKLVILRGDKEVLLGNAVDIMNIAKIAGAERIAIATEHKKSKLDEK
jgi:biopolymer transport protein ExbD